MIIYSIHETLSIIPRFLHGDPQIIYIINSLNEDTVFFLTFFLGKWTIN